MSWSGCPGTSPSADPVCVCGKQRDNDNSWPLTGHFPCISLTSRTHVQAAIQIGQPTKEAFFPSACHTCVYLHGLIEGGLKLDRVDLRHSGERVTEQATNITVWCYSTILHTHTSERERGYTHTHTHTYTHTSTLSTYSINWSSASSVDSATLRTSQPLTHSPLPPSLPLSLPSYTSQNSHLLLYP